MTRDDFLTKQLGPLTLRCFLHGDTSNIERINNDDGPLVPDAKRTSSLQSTSTIRRFFTFALLMSQLFLCHQLPPLFGRFLWGFPFHGVEESPQKRRIEFFFSEKPCSTGGFSSLLDS